MRFSISLEIISLHKLRINMRSFCLVMIVIMNAKLAIFNKRTKLSFIQFFKILITLHYTAA